MDENIRKKTIFVLDINPEAQHLWLRSVKACYQYRLHVQQLYPFETRVFRVIGSNEVRNAYNYLCGNTCEHTPSISADYLGEAVAALASTSNPLELNCGRLIYITSRQKFDKILTKIDNMIRKKNEQTEGSPNLRESRIDFCKVVLINLSRETCVHPLTRYKHFTVALHTVTSSELSAKLMELLFDDFNLTSTRIVGEVANLEIIHAKEVHAHVPTYDMTVLRLCKDDVVDLYELQKTSRKWLIAAKDYRFNAFVKLHGPLYLEKPSKRGPLLTHRVMAHEDYLYIQPLDSVYPQTKKTFNYMISDITEKLGCIFLWAQKIEESFSIIVKEQRISEVTLNWCIESLTIFSRLQFESEKFLGKCSVLTEFSHVVSTYKSQWKALEDRFSVHMTVLRKFRESRFNQNGHRKHR